MKTLLLNGMGDLPALDAVDPLFFPLRREGVLKTIDSFRKAGERHRPETAVEEVRLFLRRDRVREGEWRALFLIPFSESPPSGEEEPADRVRGCLSEQLARIEQNFLAPLRGRRLAPAATFVIVIDDGSPMPEHRRMDREGYLPEADALGAPAFGSGLLRQLDDLWRGGVVFGEADRTGEGLKGLTQSNREKVRLLTRESLHLLNRFLRELDLRASESGLTPFIGREPLREVRKRFSEGLKAAIQAVVGLPDLQPGTRLLREILWDRFSVRRLKSVRDFVCVRLRVNGPDWTSEGTEMLRLAFLIVFLTEVGDRVQRAGDHPFWQTAGLAWTDQAMREALDLYRARLGQFEKHLDQEIRTGSFKVPLSEETDSGCVLAGSLEARSLPRSSSGVWPRPDHWRKWRKEVEDLLNGMMKEGKSLMRKWSEALPPRPQAGDRLSSFDALREQETVLKQQIEEEERKLAVNRFENLAHPWPDNAEVFFRKLEESYSCRPRLLIVALCGLAIAAIFLLPHLGTIHPPEQRTAFPTLFAEAAMLVGCVAAALIPILCYRRRIGRLLKQAHGAAVNAHTVLENALDGNKMRLEDLCRLGAASRNLGYVKRALVSAGNMLEMRRAHLARIKRRIASTGSLLACFPAYRRADLPPRSEEWGDLDFEHPEWFCLAYALGEGGEFQITIEGHQPERISSTALPENVQIVLKRDNVDQWGP